MDKSSPESRYVWQDREIRFDVSLKDLQCRPGEEEIDSIDNIEDTKGNNGERGMLSITNLRMIWTCTRKPNLNLSIGYNCIINISSHIANSRLRGHTQALFVLTKYSGARYEFIFTNLVKNSPRLFSTVQTVYRAFDTSRLYRDLKLRGAIIRDQELILLPKEELFNKLNGVWNLSSDQGNLGTFYITNVRIVWFARLAENFNVSIPYIQIKSVRLRDSKFGPALVLETTPQSGSYVLGFRIDPLERLKHVFQEISNLHEIYTRKPIFGVEHTIEEKPPSLHHLKVPRKQENIEIIDSEETNDAFAAYYADGTKDSEREPEYNEQLGLAVEKLREGVTLDKLWMCIQKTS
jgi:Bardet-Biedl syndrome 5 protein